MKRLALLAVCTLAACSTTQTKDVLAEANAAYSALAAFETAAGNFCASNPATAPCPSIPFAKISAADATIYQSLTAANTAATQSNATAESVALGVVKVDLPLVLEFIPASSDPNVNAAVAALTAAVTVFVADMGATP